MRVIFSMLLLSISSFIVEAQTSDNSSQTTDTTATKKLKEVVVEAELQKTDASKTTYTPTTREKQASQTGVELIDQIGIPQLMVVNNTIQTNSGKDVAVFIDYIPAGATELQAMKITDVKRVEYYEYPSDPRLQGNQFVVNFIMTRYEYGGYVKALGNMDLPIYDSQLLANGRLQYKKMTYDVLGYGWNRNDHHTGNDFLETYRIPQQDGTMKDFQRFSNTLSGVEKRQRFQATFKATYNSEKVQAASIISGNFNHTPHSDITGNVTYTPADYPSSEYSSTSNSLSKSLFYNGYYFLALSHHNTLKFTPSYTFSHTDNNSSYTEGGFAPIFNGAVDNTNSLQGSLTFSHDFEKYGNLSISATGNYDYSRTAYSGSVESLERSKTCTASTSATYSVAAGNFYGHINVGWQWYKSVFSGIKDRHSKPWMNFSLQYGFREKHSIAAEFHYSTWPPSANYTSENIIHSTPLMYYTGNPGLFPFKAFDYYLRYTWLPNRNYSLSAYITAWNVKDRYVYCYEPYSDGLIRTIRQPLGGYVQGSYGVTTTLRFLNRSLVFTGRLSQTLNHNGKPYSVNHSSINWYARLRYYIKNWNLALYYSSPNGSPDGCMNGIWVKDKSNWNISAGWSNVHWNIRCTLYNLTRWNYRAQGQSMESHYYDTEKTYYNSSCHASARLSITYTFGFGKKVKKDNEPSVSDQTSSGILM